MKLSDLAKGRPVICRFDDIDDSNFGTVIEEPVWQPNPYDTDKEMLVVKLAGEDELVYELRARNQMVDAILDAVRAAKAKSLEPGGFLSVTFVGLKGQLKLYKATYEMPDDHRDSTDPRGNEPIGVGALESDPEDPGDEEALW